MQAHVYRNKFKSEIFTVNIIKIYYFDIFLGDIYSNKNEVVVLDPNAHINISKIFKNVKKQSISHMQSELVVFKLIYLK